MKDKKLKIFLKKYDGSPITATQLAKITGKAVGTIYNNKRKYEELGVCFKHKTQETCTDNERTYINHDNISSTETSVDIYRGLVNNYLYSIGLPQPYSDVELDSTINYSTSITLDDIKEYISKALSFKNLSVKDVLTGYTALGNLESPKRLRLTEEEKVVIKTSFIDRVGYEPEEEQLRLIGLMYKFFTTGNDKYSFVQARAGTSKTTCLQVTQDVLKYFNIKVPKIVSLTHKSLVGIKNSSTVHRDINSKFPQNLFGMEEVDLERLIEMLESVNGLTQEEYVCVDEFTLLNSFLINVLKKMYKRILFVGDTAQLGNSTSYVGPVLGTLTKQYRFAAAETTLQIDITEAHFKNDKELVKQLLKPSIIGTFKAKLKARYVSGVMKPYTDYTDSFTDFKDVLDQYKTLDSMVIAFSSDAVHHLNILMNGGDDIIKRGSKVIIKDNPSFKEVTTQGSIFIVLDSTDNGLLKATNGSDIVYLESSQVELAFALTSLKAQGSSWDHVLYIEGTASKKDIYKDIYSSVTRAKKTVRILSRGEVNTKVVNLFKLLETKEGSRNTDLYKALQYIKQEAEDAGLSTEEVLKTESKVFKSVYIQSDEKSTTYIQDQHLQSLDTPKNLTKNYGFVLITGYDEKGNELKWYPNGEDQRNKTKEEAQYLLDQHLKTGKYVTGYITEELCGGNRIVIDCDNEKTVNLFLKYKDITESYYSKDSMHLVFTVDKFFKRSSFNQEDGFKGDLLGNATYSLRNVKDNKTPNYKEAVPLPVEVEQLLSQLTK